MGASKAGSENVVDCLKRNQIKLCQIYLFEQFFFEENTKRLTKPGKICRAYKMQRNKIRHCSALFFIEFVPSLDESSLLTCEKRGTMRCIQIRTWLARRWAIGRRECPYLFPLLDEEGRGGGKGEGSLIKDACSGIPIKTPFQVMLIHWLIQSLAGCENVT